MNNNIQSPKPEWRVIVHMLEKVDIVLLNRILRRMIYYLYKLNNKEIVDLTNRFELSFIKNNQNILYTNVPNQKADLKELRRFTEEVFFIAEKNIKDSEISRNLYIWMAQERSRFLSISMDNPTISLREVRDLIARFMNIPRKELHMSKDEFVNIRVKLIKRFLSSQLKYINIAKNHILIKDFSDNLLDKIVGASEGQGKLGGKSAGLILGTKIIEDAKKQFPELKNISAPESWFLTSDTIMEFIRNNALEEMTSMKYMSTDEIRSGYPFLQQLFKNAYFTPEIIEKLENIIKKIGNNPIIVRSSSLLEDSFDASFAGKYKSLFLTNSGNKKTRLNHLLDAIAEIYASVFGPDPIEYRKERGLLDFNEEMGILIQKVIGTKVGNYFLPAFAGVAFSYNEYKWSKRINREDGMIRIVLGLGTRAVDRISGDYPFIASPAKPGLKASLNINDIVKYSQNKIDVLNLKSGNFETIDLKQLIDTHISSIPNFDKIFSKYSDGNLMPVSKVLFDHDNAQNDYVVTFHNLVENGDFMKRMDIILKALKTSIGTDVDIEFASDGETIYILQCRPQSKKKSINNISYQSTQKDIDLRTKNILFKSNKYINSGFIKDVEYFVYVSQKEYLSLSSVKEMNDIALVVSYLNNTLPKKKFILAGPGRWGSRGDIRLGIPVIYSDINKSALLIELAYISDAYIPDISFGTHFFQDLVEADIKYLPLLIGENQETTFNNKLFDKFENKFSDLMPGKFQIYQNVVKIIDFKEKQSTMSVIMDDENDYAIGYF